MKDSDRAVEHYLGASVQKVTRGSVDRGSHVGGRGRGGKGVGGARRRAGERNEERWKEMKGCQSRGRKEGKRGRNRGRGSSSRRVLVVLKGGYEEREFPLSYIFFLIFFGVPWEKFVV